MSNATLIVPLIVLVSLGLGAADAFGQNLDVPPMNTLGGITAEEGPIVVEVRGIATENFMAVFRGDSLLLPFPAFCTFLRITCGVSSDRDTLYGDFPVGQSFQIIKSARIARYGSVELEIGDSVVYENGGQLYVDRGLLEECLGLPLRFSVANLWLNVDPEISIPLVDQTQRGKKYAALMFNSAETDNGGPTATISRLLGGSVSIDWQVWGQMQKTGKSALASARLGAPFLFGTLELSGSASYQSTGRPASSLDQLTWRYVFPYSSLLRRVTIGATRTRDSYKYMAELSNAPLFQTSLFDFSTLDGHTQPGWTVELYDGPQLSQVARADSLGYYQFEIPLRYGFNDLSVREIGQHGEVRIEDHSTTLATQMLPPGRLDYTVRLLADRLDIESPVSGSGKITLGVFDWLTVEGSGTLQSSSARLTTLDSLSPTASLQTRLFGSTSMNLGYDFRNRVGSGRIDAPISRIGYYQIGVDAYSFDTTNMRASGSVSFSLGSVRTGLNAFYDAQSSSRRAEATPQVFAFFGTIGAAASVTYGWEERFGTGGETVQLPLRNGVLASTWQLMSSAVPGIFLTARSSIDHTNVLSDRLELTASTTRLWPLQLSLKCTVLDYQWKRPGVDLSLSLDLDPARLSVVSRYYDEQLVSSAALEGSVSLSQAGIQTARISSLGQSAIVVVAFHDIDRNGRRDAGDTTLGVTTATLHSGAINISRIDGAFYNLIAYMPHQIEVDRWSHAGEGLYPRRQTFPIYTLPSTVHVLQVPFTDGFDVTGMCRLASSSEGGGTAMNSPFNGLRIMLISDSPDALYTGEVFSDGTILIAGVAPGEYRIEFDGRQLEVRGIEAIALPKTISVNYGGELPELQFRLIDRSPR